MKLSKPLPKENMNFHKPGMYLISKIHKPKPENLCTLAFILPK
jgi:hypothetical protein